MVSKMPTEARTDQILDQSCTTATLTAGNLNFFSRDGSALSQTSIIAPQGDPGSPNFRFYSALSSDGDEVNTNKYQSVRGWSFAQGDPTLCDLVPLYYENFGWEESFIILSEGVYDFTFRCDFYNWSTTPGDRGVVLYRNGSSIETKIAKQMYPESWVRVSERTRLVVGDRLSCRVFSDGGSKPLWGKAGNQIRFTLMSLF